jgi:hypothetical protein
MLTEEPNLVRAARKVMEMGPRVIVAKQGEYGAALFTADGFFALPASRSRRSSTPPAPATRSPAVSSAISIPPAARSTRARCAGP